MTNESSRLTELLGTRHPIVLGPFGGLSSVELTATVSELGGLGSYGLYGYDAERIHETGAALRAATGAPFALNLWLPLATDAAPEPGAFERAVASARPFFDELGVPAPTSPPERFLPRFEEQWAAVLEVRPAVASFVFGVPPAHVVESALERGSAPERRFSSEATAPERPPTTRRFRRRTGTGARSVPTRPGRCHSAALGRCG
jgi:nitronate monooxygenase